MATNFPRATFAAPHPRPRTIRIFSADGIFIKEQAAKSRTPRASVRAAADQKQMDALLAGVIANNKIIGGSLGIAPAQAEIVFSDGAALTFSVDANGKSRFVDYREAKI
jgi:hypothetical protein